MEHKANGIFIKTDHGQCSAGNQMADIFQIQAGTGNMGLFEIKGIKAVVAVHKRLKHWNSLWMNGHLADQKLQSRGKLSAQDQSAGMKQIIPLQKGAFWRKFRNLQAGHGGNPGSRGSRIPGISGIAVLQILVQLLFTDPQLLANLGGI